MMGRNLTYISEYDLAVHRFTSNCNWHNIRVFAAFDELRLAYTIHVSRGDASYKIRANVLNMPDIFMVNAVSEITRQLFKIGKENWL